MGYMDYGFIWIMVLYGLWIRWVIWIMVYKDYGLDGLYGLWFIRIMD